VTPHVEALLTTYTLKGWCVEMVWDNNTLDISGIVDADHCDYCGTKIRYAFQLRHPQATPTESLVVGCECVRSFTDATNPTEAVAFLRSKWRQRRHYFWKKFRGGVVVVGAKDGEWWAARGAQLVEGGWTFYQRRFASAREAQHYVTQLVITGKPERVSQPKRQSMGIEAFTRAFRRQRGNTVPELEGTARER